MAVTAFFSDQFNTLAVLGDGGNNAITVGRNTAGDLLINDGAVRIFGGRASVNHASRIVVLGFCGDDTIKIDNTNGAMPTAALFGGDGNDTLLGGSAIDYLFGDAGNDFVDGNGGNDMAQLGAGDDIFQWDPGDGSDRVEGGAGRDRMIFNGSNGNENFTLSANGHRLRLFRDLGNITMDTDGIEGIDLNALGGTDTITLNDLTTTDVREFNLNLADRINGNMADTAIDTLIVNGTANADRIDLLAANGGYQVTGLAALVNVKGSSAIDNLTINGLAGDDQIAALNLPANLTQLRLDGGTGNDNLLGGAGNDVILGGDGDDVVNGGRGDDVVFLGAGNDLFGWNPGEGSDVVEGQAGTDILRFFGANVNESITISANGGRSRLFRDVGNITMDLDDVEQIDLLTLGGADIITVNDLSGTDLTRLNFNLAGNNPLLGDGQVDRVIVNGTNADDVMTMAGDNGGVQILGLAATIALTNLDVVDQLQVNALAGEDVIDASGLGASAIVLILDGGAADDVLLGSAGNDLLLGGAGDDVLLGGAGDDILDGGPGNNVTIQ
jgi:Ca2+-binding RTX toxin-like protein